MFMKDFFCLISGMTKSLLILCKSYFLFGWFVLIAVFRTIVYGFCFSVYWSTILYFFKEFILFFRLKPFWLFTGVPAFCATCLGLIGLINVFSSEETYVVSNASLVLLFLVGLNSMSYRVVTHHFASVYWNDLKLPIVVMLIQDLLMLALYGFLSIDVFNGLFDDFHAYVYFEDYARARDERARRDEILAQRARDDARARMFMTYKTSAMIEKEKTLSAEQGIASWKYKYILLYSFSLCVFICVLYIPLSPPGD